MRPLDHTGSTPRRCRPERPRSLRRCNAVARRATSPIVMSLGASSRRPSRQPVRRRRAHISNPGRSSLSRTQISSAKIRQAAEAEEQRTYTERMPDAWREVLAPLGTDAIKPHLTDAPWVVVLFQQTGACAEREIGPTYYATESCGIAAGLFIAAVHQMGLVTLTHTPLRCGSWVSSSTDRTMSERCS